MAKKDKESTDEVVDQPIVDQPVDTPSEDVAILSKEEQQKLDAEKALQQAEQNQKDEDAAKLSLEASQLNQEIFEEELPGLGTREKALKHLKENYEIPENVQRILVTQDANVFYDAYIGDGHNHAFNKKLKYFQFSKNDLE